MKHSRPRLAARLFRYPAICFFFVVGVQCIAPSLTDELVARAQSTSSEPAASRRQKVANPLNDLLNEAQHDIDTNSFEAAIPPLQKFIAEKPDVAYAHFQLAYAYTALQRGDEARAEYERTIALDPKMSEAYLNLGILLTGREPAAAVAPLRKAVELLPAQSRPRILLGTAQERAGDFSGAADSLEGAVRLDPREADAVLHLATLYFNLKRPAESETKFRDALNLQPASATAALGLAQSLDAQNKPEATDAYQKYLTLQPADAATRTRFVHLLIEQKRYDEALAELDREEQGNPPSADSLRRRADIQIAQNKLNDAILTLQRALTVAPKDVQLLDGLGRIYMQKRDFTSAEKEFQAALQLDRNNLTIWKNLGSNYYLSGNYPATLATLEVIAKSETPNAASWFIRALCYDKLRQAKPALEAYQKFLSMDEGKNPDQVWQAEERSKVLKHMLEERKR
jgi:Flp pilus assembly protein TadD